MPELQACGHHDITNYENHVMRLQQCPELVAYVLAGAPLLGGITYVNCLNHAPDRPQPHSRSAALAPQKSPSK